MLDHDIKSQLITAFSLLEGEYTLVARVAASHPSRDELVGLLSDIVTCSPKLHLVEEQAEDLSVVVIDASGQEGPFVFKAVPTGHEFSSLVIALLNLDGKGKNMPDEFTQQRIKALQGQHTLTTYISLQCTNCPEIVKALNLIALINPNIRHHIIDGALYQAEVEALRVQGVPSVYEGAELIHVGKATLAVLLEKLEHAFGTASHGAERVEKAFDVLVLGAGPAGSSAAIYAARKGQKVALITDRIGGQVTETVGIENLISTPYIVGKELALNLHQHLQQYPIELFENRHIVSAEWCEGGYGVELQSKERFVAPSLIVATGASWRKLSIPGEATYTGRGVAFCPHCDGPFYKGQEVAVIGGGNSGMEAALDLAQICSKVTVVEFMERFKADEVLQEQARKQGNIELMASTQVVEALGDGQKLTAIRLKDRLTQEERTLSLSAIFVQIGLSANSSPFSALVEVNGAGEIIIDEKCRTSAKGIYAAGDVTTVPYKQIVVAMGEGAKAALSAFEDKLNGRT